jgi:hypothetical protein
MVDNGIVTNMKKKASSNTQTADFSPKDKQYLNSRETLYMLGMSGLMGDWADTLSENFMFLKSAVSETNCRTGRLAPV